MQPRRAMVAVLTLALAAPVSAAAMSVAAPEAAVAAPQGLDATKLPRPTRDRDSAPRFDEHRVLVKFKKSATEAARRKALTARGARAVDGVTGGGFVSVTTTGRAEELLRRLQADTSVAEVSLDYIRTSQASPNDPGYTFGDQNYLKTLRLPYAWDVSKGTSSVTTAPVIAVLDSGVNGKHEDLAGRVIGGFNAITDTAIAGGSNSDNNLHGSMVAGIAGAATNNARGIAGAAWNARIMPVKVLDAQGNGLDSDIVQGIRWAADHGAKVINLSLGGPDDNPALRDAVLYAMAKNAVVVAATGNDGAMEPHYPAAIPEVVAVGATDWNGALTDFSNTGTWVDVVAPGWEMVSTGRGTVPSDEDYWIGDGTSFSAPLVSGVIALMRAKYPTYTPAQIVSRLRATARDAGPRGIDPFYGAGFVDAYRAVGGAQTSDFAQPALGTNEPNDVPARATAFTSSTSGTIGAEGDVDWYKYTNASARRPVTVKVTPPAYVGAYPQNLDPILSVYDKDLKLIGTVDADVAGAVESMTLVMDAGTYYVSVGNFNGARSTKPYSVGVADTVLPTFHPAQTVEQVVGQATTTATGDVTGDGRADVVSTVYDFTTSTDADVAVYPQSADGTLGTPVELTTDQRSIPRDVAVLDADDDGDLDVVVATDLGVQIFVQGASGLGSTPTLVSGTAGSALMAATDIEGDDDTDLVVLTPDATLLLTQSAGSLAASELDPDGASGIETGDVDGDSRPDVVMVLGTTSLRILQNKADGWTRTDRSILGYSWLGFGFEVADVTGDNRDDVVLTNAGNQPDAGVLVLAQTAEGTLNDPVKTATIDIPYAVRAGDVTSDGRTDAVVVHGSFSTVSVLKQTANGSFASPVRTNVTTLDHYHPHALSLIDLGGDGELDAVVPLPGGLGVLRNATGPTPGGAKAWVSNVGPADFAIGVSLSAAPTVTFARDVDAASVTASTVRLVHGVTGSTIPATVTYDPATRVAQVKPTAPLQEYTGYRLSVAGVTESDATMAVPFTTTFSTVNLTPSAVNTVTSRGNYLSATISWKLPTIPDLSAVVVRRSTSATAPSSPTSGTGVYSGTGTSVSVKGLASGYTYTYSIWVRDRAGKYSAPVYVRHRGTATSISSSRTSLSKGSSVTLSGKVVRKDNGAAIAGATVELWQRRAGTSTWTKITTRVANSSGAVTYKTYPTSSRDYRWIYRGSSAYMGNASSTKRITVS